MVSIITRVDDLDTERKYTEDERGARTYTTRHLVTVDVVVWQTRATVNDPWENASKATYDAETDPTLKRILDSVPESLLLLDSQMPQPHITPLDVDAYAKCRKRQVTPWESPFQFYVRITWTTHRDDEHEDRDPFARAVAGSIRCIDKIVPASQDSRGVMAVTTAGSLYKGLTTVVNIEVIEVTVYSEEWPTALRSRNNTVNAGNVTMFGETYNLRTLWMKNLRLPKIPTEQWGTLLWETTFELHHDPAGYFELLPNTDVHELQYWTREEITPDPDATYSKWVPVDFATYQAESEPELKKVTRERVQTGSQQSVAGEAWLNVHGEAITPSLLQKSATAAVTAGDKTVTLAGTVLDDTYVGTIATLLSPGINGVELAWKVRIASVAPDGLSFEMDWNSPGTKADVPIVFAGGGALFNYLEMQYEGDWSVVPLPATPPNLGNIP